MGGAASLTDSIVINLVRMNKILEINAKDRVVTAEDGITLGELDAALRQKGLMLGRDPWRAALAQPLAAAYQRKAFQAYGA
ncbi:MAG: FAD-dependent oxidoreductase [Aigarchaeota archaeon]|nr:FAD-dependent oxidoreductase [Candidatus Pelearchaeum maunauluense]